MLTVRAEKVWTRTSDDLIIPRAGAQDIVFDECHGFVNDHDLHGVPIPVEGLLSTDVAVALTARPATELSDSESSRTIFLVSDFDTADGSGILISPELVKRDPESNVTDVMHRAWSELAPASLTLKTLGLTGLTEHIRPL